MTAWMRSKASVSLELLMVFLTYSLMTVLAIGWMMRVDGVLDLNDLDYLHRLTWTGVPILALILTGLIARFVPDNRLLSLVLLNVGALAFGAFTMRLFDDPPTFNRLLGAFLLGLGLSNVSAVFLPDRWITRAMWGVGVSLFVLAAFFTPHTVNTYSDDGYVSYRTNALLVTPLTSVTLTWEAENIQAIYLNQNPTVGADTRSITYADGEQTLRVIWQSGQELTLHLGIMPASYAVLLQWGLAVALFVGLMIVKPAWEWTVPLITMVASLIFNNLQQSTPPASLDRCCRFNNPTHHLAFSVEACSQDTRVGL